MVFYGSIKNKIKSKLIDPRARKRSDLVSSFDSSSFVQATSFFWIVTASFLKPLLVPSWYSTIIPCSFSKVLTFSITSFVLEFVTVSAKSELKENSAHTHKNPNCFVIIL